MQILAIKQKDVHKKDIQGLLIYCLYHFLIKISSNNLTY